MIYTLLPTTNIKVSKICLGTMTWGEQNTQTEAFEQMDYAVSKGVNFFDTAELYSVPVKAETYGNTETIIGNWFKKNKNRAQIILASKASGPGPQHIRNSPNFSKEHITLALNQSLKRLQTEYLDLYQLHWPERHSPRFGGLNYTHKPEVIYTPFSEVVETLQEFVNEGKIRYWGISNETPWGIMKWNNASKKNNVSTPITIQNPYSLLNRVFEIGSSEVCFRENIGLLAYSPLGGGLLSGKYNKNTLPKGSRYDLFPNYFGRYKHPNTIKATEAYCALAEKHKLSPSKMALAFINQQKFVTANIIGATTMHQLQENIDSITIELSNEVIESINEIHFNYPNPAP